MDVAVPLTGPGSVSAASKNTEDELDALLMGGGMAEMAAPNSRPDDGGVGGTETA